MMYEDESTDMISLVNASNAFNSLDRQLFLHNISYLFPSIAIFVKSCHSTPSRPDGDGGVLWNKLFLEISQNSQESTCARVSFLIKLQTCGQQLY